MSADQVTKSEKELYILANIVAQNRRGRSVVLWGNSNELRDVLKKYFDIEVSFVVTILDHIVNGTSVRHLSDMRGKSDRYYLVSWGRAYEEYYDNLLHEYGYTEINDYVYRMIRPVVLENYDLSAGGYEDMYGNRIEGHEGVIGKVTFRGYHNVIKIAHGVGGLRNAEFQMCANGSIEIGEGTRFNGGVNFELNEYGGSSSIYIGRWCRFDKIFFRLFNHWHGSYVIINDNASFEKNVAIHANSGKGIVIGRDCMFSRDIVLQSGDGHTLFDLHTQKNTNTAYREEEKEKNHLFIGEHVWVCARAFILNGTYIGNGSVVAGNSTVKGAFPNNCVVAGNPAKLVKKDVAWSREGFAEDVNKSVRKEYAVMTNDTPPALWGGVKILVVGGTRFMGLHLVKELLARGNRVTIATRGRAKDPFGERIDRLVMDLDNPRTVREALKGRYYDVVFDNLAYCSNYVREILGNVRCGRYIQLSSIAVYQVRKENIEEADFDAGSMKMEWSLVDSHYARGKRNAEAAVVQGYPGTRHVIVRIPYVSKTERLYYYCDHIVNGLPMKIEDMNRGFTFVRDMEVGKFLPWIAAQDYTGAINLASTGMMTLRELVGYIERKTGKRAVYAADSGDPSPFNEQTFSLDMSRAQSLGYVTSSLNEWFWAVIDEYIDKALKNKESGQRQGDAFSQKQTAQLFGNKEAEMGWRHVARFFGQKTGNARKLLHTLADSLRIRDMPKDFPDGRKGTVEEVDAALCTGCGACRNVCPRDAIGMCPDGEGFLAPVIDHEKCTSCGLCRRICPVSSGETCMRQNMSCYALMAEDGVREASSSGGAFTLLAEQVLEAGGAVCGAAWTDDYLVKQTVIWDKDQIPRLRGSKYVQSDTGFSFRKVREILEEGRQVLYVGTPCQIDGLLHYLQRDYDNLITVDLLCRGNASNELFARFLRENYGDKTVKTINFKDKKPLGWGATTSYLFRDGSVEKTNTHNSVWMCAYLADFMDRRSCYQCRFNSPRRVGDISIGDFWGIEKYRPGLNDRKGTSIVLTSTRKGDALVRAAEDRCRILEAVPITKGIPYNSALSAHVRLTGKRAAFFDSVATMPVTAAVDRTVYGEKFDVGIVGWWYNLNYGGTLTYFALHQAVRNLGYSVLMIRKSSSGPAMPNDATVPMRFAKKHYKISRLYTARDMHWLNYSCRAFISGSDQLWNPYLEQYSGAEYYLSFVNKHNLKLSYGSSFGGISEVSPNYVGKYKPYLDRFDGITVREDYGVEICNKSWGVEARQVCDPIFLCGQAQYEELASDSKMRLPKRYLLNFLLDPNEDKRKAYRFVQESLGLAEVVNFTDLQGVEERVGKFGEDGALGNAEIEDFVKACKNADFVVTDSFHGTCLAMIFHKPFISIANRQRGARRFTSLMNWTGLGNRLVFDVDEIYRRPELLEPVDYGEAEGIMEEAREEGFDWLRGMLGKMV